MNRGRPKHIEVSSDDLTVRCKRCGKSLVYEKGQTLATYNRLHSEFVNKHWKCKEKPCI